MTPTEEHGEIRYAWLMKQREAGERWVDILLADDWRTMDSYRPSRDYVWVKYGEVHPSCMIASRGWHGHSYWCGLRNPDPLPISPIRWKPIDLTGFHSVHAYADSIFPPPEPWKRSPEPMFEPAGVDARVTPVPLVLLVAMHGGARLQERVGRWISFVLRRHGKDPERISERGVNALRKLAFIERVGTLPPGHPPRMLDFGWRVTDAGRAWIAANTNNCGKIGQTSGATRVRSG
jgi:hypothetical protein